MKNKIKRHAVLSKELTCSFEKALTYISNPENLEEWTLAIKKANDKSATLETPEGIINIGLKTISNDLGVIDWHLTMPDGKKDIAQSRLVELPNGNVLYVFTFYLENVKEDQVEEKVEKQKGVINEEFNNLQRILGE